MSALETSGRVPRTGHGLGSLVGDLVRHRRFAWEMAARELRELTKGAFLGLAWVVLRPFIQVAAYVVIVTLLFGARLSPEAGRFDYATYVLAGMVPWQILTRSLEEAAGLIRSRMDLVKQVIYPVETLPVTSLAVSSVGPLVVLATYVAVGGVSGGLTWSLLLLPLPALLLFVFVLGGSWFMMIAGVLVKDLREVVSVLLGLMVYFSPVVASEAMVGERLWSFILWNPLTHVVLCFRDVFDGTFHPLSWGIFSAMAVAAFVVGSWTLLRMKTAINEYI